MTRTTVLGHDYTLTEQGYRHCDDCHCFNSERVAAFHPAQVEAYPELKKRLKRDALYQADLERACGCCEPIHEDYDYE